MRSIQSIYITVLYKKRDAENTIKVDGHKQKEEHAKFVIYYTWNMKFILSGN